MLTVYTTNGCAFCPMVKKFLTMKNQPFQEVDVTNDLTLRKKLLDATGMSTVPVTTDGHEFVVGWNPSRLANFCK